MVSFVYSYQNITSYLSPSLMLLSIYGREKNGILIKKCGKVLYALFQRNHRD